MLFIYLYHMVTCNYNLMTCGKVTYILDPPLPASSHVTSCMIYLKILELVSNHN